MVKPATGYVRATSFAILVISLMTLIGFLSGLIYLLFGRVASAEPRQREYLVQVAWLTGAVLILSVIILIGVVLHYLAHRITQRPEKSEPLAYFDAWSESARRLKAKGVPPVELEETDSEG